MYLNFDPFRQLELLMNYPRIIYTDSEEFKDRYIENPDWKRKEIERGIEILKDRKKYYEKTADEYLRCAKETDDQLKEKEKKLTELT